MQNIYSLENAGLKVGVFLFIYFFTKNIKTLECSAVGENGSLNDERKEMKKMSEKENTNNKIHPI